MNPPFPFETLLVFGMLSLLLLAGVFLRAWLSIFQKFLFPASLTGGLLGLAATNLDLVSLNPDLIKAFAYHLFNISFISIGLTPPEEENQSRSGTSGILKGSVWMAVLQAATFSLQALIGAGLLGLFLVLGKPLFTTFGFLVPLGFNEGPGQALSIGRAWESVGFVDASTIGLTFASIGFFFAFFVGVPLANLGLRAKAFQQSPPGPYFLRGILPRGSIPGSAGGLTTHSSNLDGLAFHWAQVGLTYVLTYFLIRGLTQWLPPDVASILWGFFFLFGLVTAILLRQLFSLTSYGHLLNPSLQRRISGISVDFLIVATGCSIELVIVWNYAAPIFSMALSAGVLTTLIVLFFGRRLADFSLERSLAIYGVVTGTVSSGLLLLRIVDPELKSPVAREIGFMNVFSVPVVGGLTFILNIPLWWGWSLASTCLILLAVFVLAAVLLSWRRLWRP